MKISNCCKKLILRRKLIQAGEEEDKIGATLKVTIALHCITLHIAHCMHARITCNFSILRVLVSAPAQKQEGTVHVCA